MREEEAPRVQSIDGIEGGFPQFQLNVGRRSGRKNKGMSFNANASGITDKRNAFRRIKVRDVMGSVAGSIEHLQLPGAKRKSFASLQHVKIIFGHRPKLAKEALHIVAVKTRGACQQIRRIDHVSCAAIVHINLQMRIFLEKGTGRAGVVEVNVRQENRM